MRGTYKEVKEDMELMMFNKENGTWEDFGSPTDDYWKNYSKPWIPVYQGIGLEKKIMKWYPNYKAIISNLEPYGECVSDIETIGEEPKEPLPQHDPLQEKLNAIVENQDMLEECVIELASVVYE